MALKITLSLLLVSMAFCGIIILDDRVQYQPTRLDLLRTAQLQKHNVYRSRHGGPALALDDNLNAIAQNYANYLLSIKTLVRTTDNPYGQNLYVQKAFPNLTYTGGDATDSFYSESAYYNYDTGNTNGLGIAVNNFTQVIWKASTKVGFGFAYGTENRVNAKFQIQVMEVIYGVALYAQKGNWIGGHKENVLRPTH